MSVDWNKYPPLPEAPTLPEWRDTPEREAYWADRCSFKGLPEWSYAVPIAGGVLFVVGVSWIRCTRYCSAGWEMVVAGAVSWVFFAAWILCNQIRISKRFFRKYGFNMRKLTRTDITAAIGAILEERAVFDETEFRKYWCDDERANVALDLLTITEWCRKPAGKMLYPNDPMIIVWYGQATFSKKKVVEPQDYWYDDVAQQFGDCFEGLGTVDHDTAFVQLVEMCIVSRRRAEEAKTAKLKKR